MTTAATKRDLLAEAHEYADEIAKERADEYAKEVAEEAAKEAAEEAARESYDEAYKEAYDEAYEEAYSETYKEAYDEACGEAHQLKDIVAREALARVLERYHDDSPDEYHFALGAIAPALLQEIFGALLVGSMPNDEEEDKDRAKRRRVFRLVQKREESQ